MKNIRIILYSAVAITAATFTACERQLDEYNPGGSTAEEIWSTPQGFITAVNAAYTAQRDWYGKEDGIFMSETGTDLWFNRDKNGYARENTKYEGLSGAQGNYPRNTWPKLWAGINQCNAGIGRIDKAGFTDQAEKARRLGELRFLRAFYYYHIVETWGNVMLRTRETDSVLLTAQRSPVQDFYNVMIEDLIYAKDNLPVEWAASEYGRAAKKSAMGMLARVYLARAYYAAPNSAEATEYFTKARNIAHDVLEKQGELKCAMWDNINDVFKPTNNKRNKESLYTIVWSANNLNVNNATSGNQGHATFLTQYSNKPGLIKSIEYGRDNSRRIMPSIRFLEKYSDNDARYEAFFQEEWKSNSPAPYAWKASDLTLYNKDKNVITEGMTIPVGTTALLVTRKKIGDKRQRNYVVYDRDDIYNPTNDTIMLQSSGTHYVYPALKKFHDWQRPATAIELDAGYNDIFVIRLAEMYLIEAEAEFKLGNSAAAATLITKLRERARKNGADLTVTAGEINTDFILDERARELCGEYMRWFDLKRMLSGTEFVNRIQSLNPDVKLVQPFHRLRPVPQTELDALLNGKTEFKNNEGY